MIYKDKITQKTGEIYQQYRIGKSLSELREKDT